MLIYTFAITTLISLNYHIWINELKAIAKKARVWQYVDSDTDLAQLKSSELSQASDYQMNNNSASSLKELFVEQKKEYKADSIEYEMLDKKFERITQKLRTVNNAIRTSARQYISLNELTSSARKIVKLLADRYKLDQSKIIEQIYEQWRDLKSSLTKDKIESWIVEWENLRLQMMSLSLAGTFEDAVIFVSEFLRAGRRWASTFCDTWENQLLAAEKSVDFFKITRTYRIVVNRENQSFFSSSRFANAAILQDVTQDQSTRDESFNQSEQSFNQDGQGQSGSGQAGQSNKGKSKDNNPRKLNERCICRDMHIFKECSYIVSFNRKSGWKENKSIRNQMRKQIRNRLMVFRVISKITNTNILDGFSDEIKKSGDENISLMKGFRFGNMTMSSHMNNNHSLYKSVIYDSRCSDSLTYDRDRFVSEIRFADEWIKI